MRVGNEIYYKQHKHKGLITLKKSDIKTLLIQIETFGELIRVESKINECRDPKDNFLLSLSVDGKADFLVTGDSDLLVLGKIEKTKIVSWAEFISQE